LSTKEEVIRLIKNMPNNVTTEEIMKKLYEKIKMDQELEKTHPAGTPSDQNSSGKLGKWLH
jgi:hypothetical protein